MCGRIRNQWLDDQRDRDASDRDLSLSCTRAWLSEDEIGIDQVRLYYSFDSLFGSKLQQVYELLVPDQVRIIGEPRVAGPVGASSWQPPVQGQEVAHTDDL